MSCATDIAVRSALHLLVARIGVPRAQRKISETIDLVAWHTGIGRDVIVGPSRAREPFKARAAVSWVAAELGFSSTVIGRVLGGRDPSTISDACRRAREMRLNEQAFARMTDRVRDHFRDLQED